MTNPYLECVEADPKLYRAVQASLAGTQTLAPLQIEKLVFYLKSLHTFYAQSANHVAYSAEFSKRLDGLRNSDEQRSLQRQATASIFKGVALCVLAGALLMVAAAQFLGREHAFAVGASLGALVLILIAVAKCFRDAVVVSKEQDRKYFLASIRAAKACNELDWSGLFTYHRATKFGPHSDEDLKRVHAAIGELASNLRSALYNDEYFQYSDPGLSEPTASDA